MNEHSLPPAMARQLEEIACGARNRAQANKWPFEPLLAALFYDLFMSQRGRCAVSGLLFDLRVVGTGQARRPYAPSPDRIDPQGGYVRGNVRLVLQAVNFARNRFGDDVLTEVATGIVALSLVGQHPAAGTGEVIPLTAPMTMVADFYQRLIALGVSSERAGDAAAAVLHRPFTPADAATLHDVLIEAGVPAGKAEAAVSALVGRPVRRNLETTLPDLPSAHLGSTEVVTIMKWRPIEAWDIPSREEFETFTLQLLRHGITNSDQMRQKICRERKLILSKAIGNWNETPSGKFTNEHAFVLKGLVERRIIENLAPKEYRLLELGQRQLLKLASR